nr:MAG TPA: hypothetical protein [Caudoviricetes sp.]
MCRLSHQRPLETVAVPVQYWNQPASSGLYMKGKVNHDPTQL